MKNRLLAMIVAVAIHGCIEPQTKSKTVSMEQKQGKTVDWAHNTNIYEVNVRQYTPEGTFAAFATHLPRLKDMGVHTLWFMPITPIAQKNKKGSLGSQYACSDYTAINPEFGTLADFKAVVQQAHSMGFKVIIDWVANHTGWDHRWTTEHPDYYLHDSATNNFKIASGMDDIIELDYSNPALRRAMIDAMKYWVNECDIDGFRCDLAAWVEADFWAEARPAVDSVKKLFWLGEFDELENPEHGKVFDASYSWKWMHLTKNFYQDSLPLDTLRDLLEQYSRLGDSSMRAWFTSNHDENTWNGTEYEKYGNMAKALAVFSATWNGVPLIYNGQELPLLTKRLAFFEKDPIPWVPDPALHEFYESLLKTKANHAALRGGDPDVRTNILHTSDSAHVMAYQRLNGTDEIVVLMNMSREAVVHFTINESLSGSYYDIFTGGVVEVQPGKQYELKAWEYLVLKK